MNSKLVMSKDEIAEMREKAKEVKSTGIPSKKLPQTEYELRVKEFHQEANKELTETIELSEDMCQKLKDVSTDVYLPPPDQEPDTIDQKELSLQLDEVVLMEFLQNDQNEFVLQWSLDEFILAEDWCYISSYTTLCNNKIFGVPYISWVYLSVHQTRKWGMIDMRF